VLSALWTSRCYAGGPIPAGVFIFDPNREQKIYGGGKFRERDRPKSHCWPNHRTPTPTAKS
jgi:hypothetical protein